jgi:hypothetical protein
MQHETAAKAEEMPTFDASASASAAESPATIRWNSGRKINQYWHLYLLFHSENTLYNELGIAQNIA